MLRIFAIILGIIFVILAVLGFMPEYVQEGKLLAIARECRPKG